MPHAARDPQLERGHRAAVSAKKTQVQEWPSKEKRNQPKGSRSQKEVAAKKAEYGGDTVVSAASGQVVRVLGRN